MRDRHEWFDEPDDVERLTDALSQIVDERDAVAAAARLAFRVARAQAFAEGNKRTALLMARWMLDNNDQDGEHILPSDDIAFAELLVKAASGVDVEPELIQLLTRRRTTK